MKTIYKYSIQLTEHGKVFLPPSYKVLSVGIDPQGVLCMWVEINTDILTLRGNSVTLNTHVVGTGNKIPDGDLDFIGSVKDGVFMWHVYTSKFTS